MRAFDLRATMVDDELLWEERELPVSLQTGEVQVWRATSNVSSAERQGYRALLAPHELERMERMRVGLAREEFVVGRGLLRQLVGAALGMDARALIFGRGEHGKPEISGLEFNVSHSKGVILIALCRDAAVGVDVEWMDETIEALDIARQAFTAEEYRRTAMLPKGPRRTRAFYECWVRKEAVTKAHGAGLSLETASFAVPFEEPAEMAVRVGPGGEGELFVRSLRMGENFLAAIALKKEGFALRCHRVKQSVQIV